MTILVTGGAGFIGSHLVERLVGRGDAVVALDNLNDYYDPAVKRRNLSDVAGAAGFNLVEGDILDAGLLQSLFDRHKFDAVIHLAARAGVLPSLAAPVLYAETNCQGTLNLLEAVRRAGVARFVFASSSSVYGASTAPPFREDADISRPLSPYAATKAAAELFCANYNHLYGMSCTVLRFFTVYGARQRPDMAIHKFTRLIREGKPIPFYGDGSSERDYTYYSDIIDGVVAAVDRDLGFEIINLGESRTTSLSRLVTLLGEKLGREPVLDRMPSRPGDMKATCADVTKAGRFLGYRPATTIEDGIGSFVSWYNAQQT